MAQTTSYWPKWLGPVLVPAIGAIWYLAYPLMRGPVSRLLDSLIVAAFSAAIFFTPHLTSFRLQLGLALTLILGYALLFYYATVIAFHYSSFGFILLLGLLVSLGPQSPEPQPKLSLKESFRYFQRMLRNQPSEKEAELLAAIRLNRRADKT